MSATARMRSQKRRSGALLTSDRLCPLRLILAFLLAAPVAGAAVAQHGAAPGESRLIAAGYKLNHWSIEEGAPSRINDFAQSGDGFLWIGGVEGLTRFDGVTFEKIGDPSPDQPRIVVSRLMAARSGGLWVGLARNRGVMVWRKGRLLDTGMPHPSREVNDIEEDARGDVWVARGGRGFRSLARFSAGRWIEYGSESGLPEQPVWSILPARDGSLWVALESTVVVRRPEAARFEPTGIRVSPRADLAQDSLGQIWLADRQHTSRIVSDRRGYALREPAFSAGEKAGGMRILFDREGDLWETTGNKGIFRIVLHANRAERRQPNPPETLTSASGLLSDQVRALFEDREGNIWIGTELGLNMVRRVAVRIATGIPENSPTSYQLAVDRKGIVYVAEASGLYEIRPGEPPRRRLPARSPIEALCADWREGVWFVTGDQVARLAGEQVRYYPKPHMLARGCAHDAAGRLWLPALQSGLYWLERGAWHSWPGAGADAGLPDNAVALPDGRAAIHFRSRPPALGRPPFLAVTDNLVARGGVEGLFPGTETLLTSGAAGLSAPLLPGRPMLSGGAHRWAVSLNGLVQTRAGATWAIGDQGIVHLKSGDLARALGVSGRTVPYEVFDFRDGLNSFAQKSPGGQIAEGRDGRLWFATRRNIVTIDPGDIPRNSLPPTPAVMRLAAGTQSFPPQPGLVLPAATGRVDIAYTAASLSVPQRVRFRFRLKGLSDHWSDPESARVAAFGGLGPGDYVFELVAANDNGIWSPRPVRIAFSIPAAFYQTWWFRLLAAAAVAAILYVVFALRLRRVSRIIRERLLERTRERERIARELHDTMIQGIQGLIMRFQAVADHLAHDRDAQAILIPALDRAEEMLIEGRDRVKGLRRPEERDLQAEIARLPGRYPFDPATRVSISRKGVPRPVAAEIADDVIAIVGEALCNAALHAQAEEVEVVINYKRLSLGVFVRDDGVGISPDVQLKGGRPGHFGLTGMRERARRIKAKLSIESGQGFGTLVEFRVAGKLAYAN